MKTSKIFFTDLDGTLLNDEKEVTPATRNAIDAWTAAGNKFVLCSGRAIDSIKHVKQTMELDFPGIYLIGYNGGEIYDCAIDQVVSRIPLSMEQVSLIMKMAKEHNVYCHTYTDTHIISPAECEEMSYYQRAIVSPVIICEDIVSALDKEPCKCIAIEIHNPDKLENFRQSLHALIGNEISLLYSNEKYLEIFSAKSGKGASILKLCELLDIPVAHTLAAGDAANDISMIQTAGIGIAMANATEEVKNIADIITEHDNNEDGLAPLLLAHL